MGRKGPTTPPRFSEKELAFIANYNGDVCKAMRAAGYKETSLTYGYRLIKRPDVHAAIMAKQAKVIDIAAKEYGKAIVASDITDRVLKAIDRLDKIAAESLESEGLVAHARACEAIAKACDALAELTGNKVHLSADVTKLLEGRTVEEKEFFAVNGYWPNEQPPTPESESSSAARRSTN